MNDPAFSKTVVKIIVKAITTETSRLRNILRATGGDSETKKNDDEPSCEQPFPLPQFEPTEDHNGERCLEVVNKEYRTVNHSSVSPLEYPYRESPIELLPVDSEVAKSKVYNSPEDSDDSDWAFQGSK